MIRPIQILLLAMVLVPEANLQGQILRQIYSRPFAAGARAASMGDAYVGENEDPTALYWNPASLSFTSSRVIVTSLSIDWNLEQAYQNIVLPLRLNSGNSVAIGVAASFYGNSWSQPYFANQGIDLAYATRITPTLSVGVLSNLRYGKTRESSLFAGSAVIGVMYFPNPGISYGLVFKTIGSGILYSYQGAKESLTYEENLPRSLIVGSTFRYPTTGLHPYVCVSMNSELVLGLGEYRNKAGIEFQPWEFLALRVGTLSTDSGNAVRFGMGIQFNLIHIDYAISPKSASQRFQQLSMALRLGKD